jgi:hypothetical protein
MSSPPIQVRLEQECYRPGELLAGAFALSADEPAELTRLELSVLWHTEGKGDEDLGVIHFEEWSGERAASFDLCQPHGFSVTLPRTPLSYDGVSIKIHWCARVRARWAGREETVAEAPFLLRQGPPGGPAR